MYIFVSSTTATIVLFQTDNFKDTASPVSLRFICCHYQRLPLNTLDKVFIVNAKAVCWYDQRFINDLGGDFMYWNIAPPNLTENHYFSFFLYIIGCCNIATQNKKSSKVWKKMVAKKKRKKYIQYNSPRTRKQKTYLRLETILWWTNQYVLSLLIMVLYLLCRLFRPCAFVLVNKWYQP